MLSVDLWLMTGGGVGVVVECLSPHTRPRCAKLEGLELTGTSAGSEVNASG